MIAQLCLNLFTMQGDLFDLGLGPKGTSYSPAFWPEQFTWTALSMGSRGSHTEWLSLLFLDNSFSCIWLKINYSLVRSLFGHGFYCFYAVFLIHFPIVFITSLSQFLRNEWWFLFLNVFLVLDCHASYNMLEFSLPLRRHCSLFVFSCSGGFLKIIFTSAEKGTNK